MTAEEQGPSLLVAYRPTRRESYGYVCFWHERPPGGNPYLDGGVWTTSPSHLVEWSARHNNCIRKLDNKALIRAIQPRLDLFAKKKGSQ